MKYFFLCLTLFFYQQTNAQGKLSPFSFYAELKSDLGANIIGGAGLGTAYMGNLDFVIEFDTEKANLWPGGIFQLYILNSHGSQLSLYSGDFQIASNIEAFPSTRLYQFWYLQKIWNFTLILGQHDLNSEFAFPENGETFLNSSFGIQPDISANVPISIFPIATLGAVLKYDVNKLLSFQIAAYDGDPGDELTNPNSVNWDLNSTEGALTISEIKLNLANSNRRKSSIKIGAWHHTANIKSHHPIDKIFKSTQGYYFISDVTLFQRVSTTNKQINIFTQSGIAPKDCNKVDGYIGGGIVFKGFIPGRQKDSFGLAAGHANICNKLQSDNPLSSESIFELTYKTILNSHFTIQPDFQYIINPGGNSMKPNAVVAILRIKIRT